ncbi:MAG TPA: nuclear transport factor 2 family protein [Solirubrobacterales bacterium]|nr:nuclear transport factor 2 family protein [Solirubrobacterales bacterium]
MSGTDAKDTIVASYEALNQREIDAAMDALADEAEWHESAVLPDTGVYRGKDAIRAFLTQFLASWDRFHQTVEEAREEGDRVLVLIHLEATGRGSAADVDARYAHLWTVSDGRGIRVDAFYDRDEALAALKP